MQLTLRELLKRLPRYLVMVNPSKMMGVPGEWQNLSAHDTVLEALRQCSIYMGETKLEMGIQLTSMCPNHAKRGSLVSGKRADEDWFREHTAAAARACQKLGVDTLLIIPGGVTASVPYDICYERAVRGLKSLRPIADETGVNLAVEYVWNDFFLSPLEIRAALDEVDHPQIGFYMDTGNMVAFAYPEQWIRILGRHVKKVHTKNFCRRPKWSWPALLKEGDVSWERVMAALKLIGYDGPLISEMSGTPEEHAENAVFTKALYGAA